MTTEKTAHSHATSPGVTVWDTAFAPSIQQALLEDDRQAWRGIVGLLIAIVSVGVTLFGMCALMICRT